MSPLRILAFALLIAGALALAYGGFTYTRDTHTAELGPLSFTVKERERINVPVWVGLGAVVIGGVMLLVGGRRR